MSSEGIMLQLKDHHSIKRGTNLIRWIKYNFYIDIINTT